LRRYARALTRNRERADDLVQDTLGRALIKEQFWQPGTNLRAWLFTIMHNQNINNIRRDIPGSAVVDMDQMSATLMATTDPTASRKMFELERALARLPLEQRQVILLVGLEVWRAVDDRQFDGRAQCPGGAPTRSVGPAVSAVSRRPSR
jgi:RNA polymerase sigma-70 factor (ECF subfamily)